MKKKLQYKIVSFDIWGTLLRNSPEFIEARSKLFAEAMSHPDIDFIKKIKDEVDIDQDHRAEDTGEDSDFNTRIGLMMEKVGKNINEVPEGFFKDLRQKLNMLLLKHLPILIEPTTVKVFKDLKKQGVKIALISNTGFLHGDIMRLALKKLGVLKYVDYAVFSNEIGFAKPHKNIYQNLLTASHVLPQYVLHVGDSLKADYNGPWKWDIHSILFDPKNKYGNRFASISNIMNMVLLVEKGEPVLHYRNMAISSLHEEGGAIIDQNNTPFDFVSYSKFKYGDGMVAKKYGHQLAEKFIQTYPNLFDSSESEINLVLTTSPYKAIVKGSSGIVKGFKNYINNYLLSINKTSIVDIIILKSEMFQGDYGTFSDEQRKELMEKNDLYIMENFVKDKILILIDDARITGSHENNLITFLKNKNIKEAFFLYIADMEIKFAKENPDIESKMNHGWVDSLDKVGEIINSREFILNARVCKYILSRDNTVHIIKFLEEIPDTVLYDLYSGIVGDGYGLMPLYANIFSILKQEVERRKLLEI